MIVLNILFLSNSDFFQLEEEPISDYDFEYGFGAAKHFMPLPNTVVGSHCAWELRLNTVANRIPGDRSLLVIYSTAS